MKRLLWLGAGIAIGALVVRAAAKKAQSYSPRGLAAAARDSGRSALGSMRDFIDDVRDGMHEREQQLREAFVEGTVFDDEELPDRYVDDVEDDHLPREGTR